MTLFSSKIMNIQSILRLNCKALLGCLTVATITRNNSWWVLQSSSFHENTKTYFEQATLFSTDSKKGRKNKDDDGNITKKVTSSLEKTSRHYTKEQDELILARVKEMGYDNPETWKSLAKDFNMKWPVNIKRRCDLLLRRGTGTLQRRNFTKEDDALILQKVEEMGYGIETWKTLAHELDRDPTPAYLDVIKRRYDLLLRRGTGTLQRRDFTKEEDALILQKVEEMGYGIETWKKLAHELDRDPTPNWLNVIKTRYDLITNRDIKEKKRFTEEDDNFILNYVEKNGESKTAWQELATKLGMDHPQNIERDYHNLQENYVKGKFTKAEDQLILNDVKVHGDNLKTYKKLGEKLNRIHYQNIRPRFEHLQNKPSKKQGHWEIDEDQMLMEHIFQVMNYEYE